LVCGFGLRPWKGLWQPKAAARFSLYPAPPAFTRRGSRAPAQIFSRQRGGDSRRSNAAQAAAWPAKDKGHDGPQPARRGVPSRPPSPSRGIASGPSENARSRTWPPRSPPLARRVDIRHRSYVQATRAFGPRELARLLNERKGDCGPTAVSAGGAPMPSAPAACGCQRLDATGV